jgi:hypothetical protein
MAHRGLACDCGVKIDHEKATLVEEHLHRGLMLLEEATMVHDEMSPADIDVGICNTRLRGSRGSRTCGPSPLCIGSSNQHLIAKLCPDGIGQRRQVTKDATPAPSHLACPDAHIFPSMAASGRGDTAPLPLASGLRRLETFYDASQ